MARDEKQLPELAEKARTAGLLSFQDTRWVLKVPVSRFSASLIAMVLLVSGLVEQISSRTVSRWLAAERIRPWRFRSWITPKALPLFLERASTVLDVYERVAKGLLKPNECVLSIDEKTSIQARQRDTNDPPAPDEPAKVQHSYVRRGAVQLISALNVASGHVFGEVYDSKKFQQFRDFLSRLFLHSLALGYRHLHLVLDNGSCHRPQSWATWLPELLQEDPRFNELSVTIHFLPPRSSWLNQVEIFFSILQARVLSPCDFKSREELKARILDYIAWHNLTAQPFRWSYTSLDLYRNFVGPLSRDLAAIWPAPPLSDLW